MAEQAAAAMTEQPVAEEPVVDAPESEQQARICPVCGAVIEPHFNFCPGCAHPVAELFPVEPAEVHKRCPQCGKIWDDDMNFCADCGVPLVVG